MRPIAPGGKLKRRQVEALRRNPSRFEQFEVTQRQAHRIASGESWPNGWVPSKMQFPAEKKACENCGRIYWRKYPNGRRMGQKHWDQKRTCTGSCQMSLAWAEGRFADRARPRR